MDNSNRWRNFFSNVSHIHIKPTTSEETIKALAIAAKNVENRPILFDAVESLYHI